MNTSVAALYCGLGTSVNDVNIMNNMHLGLGTSVNDIDASVSGDECKQINKMHLSSGDELNAQCHIRKSLGTRWEVRIGGLRFQVQR